jgi:hypothetical protein
LDGQKTKVSTVFFFIFMSFYAEMSFCSQKKRKNLQNFFSNGSIGVKNPYFYADFKMGQFSFVTSSYQKLEPKYRFQKKVPKNRIFGFNF